MKIKTLLSVFLAAAAAAVSVVSCGMTAGAEGVTGIFSAEGLANISGDGVYAINQDIDLSGFDWQGIPEFSGKLYGRGHRITGLRSDAGLFGKLRSGAEIVDLRLENCEIVSEGKYVGGIASYIPSGAENVLISGCTVSGLVEGRIHTGALVGCNRSASAEIAQCSSSARVLGDFDVGGLVGLNYGSVSDSVFAGRLDARGNDHEHCDCVDDMHTELYCLTMIQGGIAGVNFGSISDSVVLAVPSGSEYLGMISGINIRGKGKLTDCRSLNDWLKYAEYDIQYDPVSVVMTRKQYNAVAA